MICNLNLRALCVLAVVVAVIQAVPARVYAQVTGGTISGTVTDSTGKVLPNVHISITNLATEVSREVTTNEEGFYSAPNLLPGTYEMKFSAPGFKTEAQRSHADGCGLRITRPDPARRFDYGNGRGPERSSSRADL